MCRLVFFFLLFIFIWLPPTFLCVFLRHGSLTSSRQRFTPLTHQKKNRKDPSDGLMMSELRPEKNKGASPVERNLWLVRVRYCYVARNCQVIHRRMLLFFPAPSSILIFFSTQFLVSFFLFLFWWLTSFFASCSVPELVPDSGTVVYRDHVYNKRLVCFVFCIFLFLSVSVVLNPILLIHSKSTFDFFFQCLFVCLLHVNRSIENDKEWSVVVSGSFLICLCHLYNSQQGISTRERNTTTNSSDGKI
jgi:hypothetical protein